MHFATVKEHALRFSSTPPICLVEVSEKTFSHLHPLLTPMKSKLKKIISPHGGQTMFPRRCLASPSSCPEGSVLRSNSCVNFNECMQWQPCHNGGKCRDLQPEDGGYICDCLDGFHGPDCAIVLEETILKPSTDFVVAIIVCIIVLLSKFSLVTDILLIFFLLAEASSVASHKPKCVCVSGGCWHHRI